MAINLPKKEYDPQENAKAIECYENYVNPTHAKLLRMMGLDSAAGEANGCYITDQKGNTYLDCLGGYGVFSLGHRHPEVVRAVRLQLDKMALSSKILLDESLALLGEKLAQITPGDLRYSFFCNSGAEAVEAALKFARLTKKKPGIISTFNGFHGKTLGALSITGRDAFRLSSEPLLPQVHFVPYGQLEPVRSALDENVAAIIVEPVQGEGGVHVPPYGYLTGLRKICDEEGILLIADEVQTGLGRTGYLFACEAENVVPDIMVMAKALGGGVMPIGAITVRPPVWDVLLREPLIHTSTFGGNPLACSAALAALHVLTEGCLLEEVREKGEYLLDQLQIFPKIYPSVVKEIRGRGLLVGIELTEEAAGGVVMAQLLEHKILVAYTLNNPKVIRVEPPFLITQQELDYFVAALDNAIKYTEEIMAL